MTIEVYAFKDADDNEHTFTTMDPKEAENYARENNLLWVAHKYEFDDSEVVKDFRPTLEELTEEEAAFWEVVEDIGWGTKTTDYHTAKFDIMKLLRFNSDNIDGFRDTFFRLRNNLYELSQKEGTGQHYINLSDDGLSDLLSHVVGAGKDVYTAALDNFETVYKRSKAPYGTPKSYTESFAYAVPSVEDLEDINPDKYIKWAKEVREKYLKAASNKYTVEIHHECKLIADYLAHVVRSDFDLFVDAEISINKHLEKIENFNKDVKVSGVDISNYWAVMDLLSGLKMFKDYFK